MLATFGRVGLRVPTPIGGRRTLFFFSHVRFSGGIRSGEAAGGMSCIC